MPDPALPPPPSSIRVVIRVSPRDGIVIHQTLVERPLSAASGDVEIFVDECTPIEQVMGETALVERDVERAAQAVVRLVECSTDIALEAVRQASHGNAMFLQSLLGERIYTLVRPEELVRYFARFYP